MYDKFSHITKHFRYATLYGGHWEPKWISWPVLFMEGLYIVSFSPDLQLIACRQSQNLNLLSFWLLWEWTTQLYDHGNRVCNPSQYSKPLDWAETVAIAVQCRLMWLERTVVFYPLPRGDFLFIELWCALKEKLQASDESNP